jgi:hypothetical protein
MKNLYLLLFILLFSSSLKAQLLFDITGKGQFNSTWLFNQNVSDKGEEQDYAPAWGSNFGLGLGIRMGFFGFGLETNWGKHNAEYSGVVATQDYTSKVALSTFQAPMFFRFQNKGGAYFELGAQYNKIRNATYSRENFLPTTANVSSNYAKSYTTGFIGFGVNARIVKSLPLSILFGFRLQYGIKDAKGVDALGNSLSNSLFYSTYHKTRAASAGLNLGVTYTIDTEKNNNQY